MNNASFKRFKEAYLHKFKVCYKKADNKKQRDEIKRSIYDNPKLTEKEKKEFWTMVIEKRR